MNTMLGYQIFSLRRYGTLAFFYAVAKRKGGAGGFSASAAAYPCVNRGLPEGNGITAVVHVRRQVL